MNLLNEPWRELERRERREQWLALVFELAVWAAWFVLGIGLGMWICGH